VGSIPTLGTIHEYHDPGADSSAVERLPYKQEVAGSNPVSPTSNAMFFA
jgi:hypothetical protein